MYESRLFSSRPIPAKTCATVPPQLGSIVEKPLLGSRLLDSIRQAFDGHLKFPLRRRAEPFPALSSEKCSPQVSVAGETGIIEKLSHPLASIKHASFDSARGRTNNLSNLFNRFLVVVDPIDHFSLSCRELR
jgi:hypothetical protein